eukprot:gene1412-1754_t
MSRRMPQEAPRVEVSAHTRAEFAKEVFDKLQRKLDQKQQSAEWQIQLEEAALRPQQEEGPTHQAAQRHHASDGGQKPHSRSAPHGYEAAAAAAGRDDRDDRGRAADSYDRSGDMDRPAYLKRRTSRSSSRSRSPRR